MNAKLKDYLVSRASPTVNVSTHPGYGWHHKTTNGTTIQDALNYATQQSPGDETASELWPDVIAVGSVYGDPGNNYASFLLQHAGTTYPADAQFLWNQPFSAENLVSNSTSPASPPALAPVSVPTDTVGAPHSSGTTRSIPGHLTSSLTFWITLSSITLVYWDFIGIY